MEDPEAAKHPSPSTSTPTPPMSMKEIISLGRRHSFYAGQAGKPPRFNFVALHRMNMHFLRQRLLDEAAVVFTTGAMTDENSDRLTGLMRDYCTAVRDRDYMRDLAQRDWESNPFHLKPERGALEASLLASLLAKGIPAEPVMTPQEDAALPRFPGGMWDVPSAMKARRERYAGAVVGGLILTVPMILMVLLRGVTVNLVIASVSTVMFALGATYFSPTKLPVEMLGVTAAYAAVLVVFVGGSVTPG